MTWTVFIIGMLLTLLCLITGIWKMYLKVFLEFVIAILIFLALCYFIGDEKVASNERLKRLKKNSSVDEQTLETANNSYAVSSSDIVRYAEQFVGNPYVWGGNSLTNGCDCSHFVWNVLKDTGHYNGDWHSSTEWVNVGEPVNGVNNARAGDIVVYDFIGGVGHVAIYDGNGLIIEARGEDYGIVHNRAIDHGRTILGIRRFP